MERAIKYVHCKAKRFIKKGTPQTENRGKIQVYTCLDCGRKFTNDDGFYRMRNSEQKITAVIYKVFYLCHLIITK